MSDEKLVEFEGYMRSEEFVSNALGLRKAMSDRSVDMGIETQSGGLRIYHDMETLTQAFVHGEDNNPWDDQLRDFKRDWRVLDSAQWARDVWSALRLVLLDEEEDGSSELTRLLDKAFIRAIEDGSNAVEEDGRAHKELEKEVPETGNAPSGLGTH